MENVSNTSPRVEKINYTEKLKSILAVAANEINAEAQSHGLGDLVNPDCTICMANFAKTDDPDQGIFEQHEINRDLKEVEKMEMEFSGANLPAVQKHFHEQKGIDTPAGIVKAWQISKTENKNGQTEMVITALLHKILRKSFLIVRSSSFDDFKSGMDNIILDKQTGEAICAFDEVHEGGEGDRIDKKKEKIKKIALKGGVSARYGISLKDERLKRAKMEKMPVFYLGLNNNDLLELMRAMPSNLEEISPVEQQIFGHLVKSLRAQKEMLIALDLSPSLKAQLTRFEVTLQKLESI